MSFALFTFPPFCRFLASWPLGQSCLAGCGRAEDRRLERATLEADCRGARDVSARTLARTPNSDCEVQMLKLAVGFNELTPGAPRVGASRSESERVGESLSVRLGHLWDSNLEKHQPAIKEILARAQGEMGLEQFLAEAQVDARVPGQAGRPRSWPGEGEVEQL